MTTKELDLALMKQYSIESMMEGFGEEFSPNLSEDINMAFFQQQATDFCLKSKGFLCSHYVSEDLHGAVFAKTMKNYMTEYRNNASNRINKAMKSLCDSDFDVLIQQISMLAMHAQFKEVSDIHNISREIVSQSLNPDSVSTAIALYVYYTLLVNTNITPLSYNELFVKSWYSYYENWLARHFMFKMNGNEWKMQFKGVLLD